MKDIAPLETAGHQHGIVGRSRGALSGFFEASHSARALLSASHQMEAELQRAFNVYWSDEVATEKVHEHG